MILLKSGIGAKIALGALGLMLGFGGITAGAQWHAAHNPHVANRRLFVGHIIALQGTQMTLRTRSGATVTIHLLPHTTIRQHGKDVPAAMLRVGDTVLVRTNHAKNDKLSALFISITKTAPTAQGP